MPLLHRYRSASLRCSYHRQTKLVSSLAPERASERRSAEAAKYEMSNELVFAWMDGITCDLHSYDAMHMLWWHVLGPKLSLVMGCVKLGEKKLRLAAFCG